MKVRIVNLIAMLSMLAGPGQRTSSAAEGHKYLTLRGTFVGLFEQRSYVRVIGPDKTAKPRAFRYRLFVPAVEHDKTYPLIVWLHGNGETGNDNLSQLIHLDELIFRPPWRRQRYPFFLLAVQCPADTNWSASNVASQDDMIQIALEILEQTLSDERIDKDRIILSGLSTGGTACWQTALRKPGQFAAMAPLASTFSDRSAITSLIDTPVWAFNSGGDPWSSRAGVESAIKALDGAGGKAVLTATDTEGHDCWTAAFARYYLLDWMLAQKRNDSDSWSPGVIPIAVRLRGQCAAFANVFRGWTWWQLLAQVTIPGLLIAGAIAILRRSRARLARDQVR